MSVTIDSLELEIKSSATSAKSSIDALSASLSKLKTSVSSITTSLSSFRTALNNISSTVTTLNSIAIGNLSDGLGKLGTSLSSISIPANCAKNIEEFASAVKKIDKHALEQFGTHCKSLATKLEPLATQLKSISESAKATQTSITSTAASTKSLDTNTKELDKSTKSYNTTGKAQSNVFTELKSKITSFTNNIKKGVSSVIKWVTESNKYIETVNLFTIAMGDYAAEAQEYANKVSDLMGIDPSAWMQQQGVFNSLITTFGVASDRAAVMSTQLTQLGYDLSSLYDISYEDAFAKLQSGISGELEPLRRLGVDLSKANLEAVALSLGIDKSYDSMTQSEKAQLRYYTIMKQTTAAQGDMSRTLDSPANQLRILNAQLTQLARSAGNIFIPVLTKILPYLTAAVKVLRELVDVVGKLVGFTLPEVDYSGLNSAASGASDTSDAIDDATASAKKLKNTILGIDELNVMQDNSDSSSGSGDDASIGSDWDFELPSYDFIGDAANSKANQITETLREMLGLTQEITSWTDLANIAVTNIESTLETLGTKAGTLINNFFTNFDSSIIGTVALEAVETLFDTVNNLVRTIDWTLIGATLAEVINSNFADMDMSKVVGTLQGVLDGTLNFIIEFLKQVDWYQIGANILQMFGEIDWKSLLGNAGTTITAAASGIMDLLLGAVGGVDLGEIVADLISGIGNFTANLDFGEILAKIGTFLLELLTQVPGIIIGILEGSADAYSSIFSALGLDCVAGFFDGIKEKLKKAREWLKENLVDPVVDWVKGLFGIHSPSTVFSGIGTNLIEGLKEGIKETWGKITEFFGEKIDTLKSTFADAWVSIKLTAQKGFSSIKSRILSIWDGVWSGLKNTLNSILGGIEWMVNGVIKGINKMIGALNKVSFDIPDWVPELGGKSFGFNIKTIQEVKIPQLAKGGMLNAGTMFIAGEAGAEVVGNVGNRTGVLNTEQMRDSVAQGVMQANAEQNSLLREEISILRNLLAKDSTVRAYVGTSSLVSGLERKNRRDGKTIVPLGT